MDIQPEYLARCCLTVVLELHTDDRGRKPNPKSFDSICELRAVSFDRYHCERIDRLAGQTITRLAVSRYPEKRRCDFEWAGSVAPDKARELFAAYQTQRDTHRAHMRLAVDILAAEGVLVQVPNRVLRPGEVLSEWYTASDMRLWELATQSEANA